MGGWGDRAPGAPCRFPGAGRLGTRGFCGLRTHAQKAQCGSLIQLLTGLQSSRSRCCLAHPSGIAPAGLAPRGWWPGELLVLGQSQPVPHCQVVVWQSGCWKILHFWESGNPSPLGKPVLHGVVLGGWRTELKIASLGNGAGVEHSSPCSPSCHLWGCAGRGTVQSAVLDGLQPCWVHLSPCTQGCSEGPTTPEAA